MTTSFVRDPSGKLLHQRAGAVALYYVLDGVGSVVAVTDQTGHVVASFDYDPFGAAATAGGVAAAVPWRFASGYLDPSGLYKYGERYYDPSLGRWTQQDPIHDAFDPMQWNRYTYVGNNPINFTDPSGLSWWNPASWDWCGSGWARAARALSLWPPFGSSSKKLWGGSAQGWVLFNLGNLVSYHAGQLQGVVARGALTFAGRASVGLTLAATGWDALCR